MTVWLKQSTAVTLVMGPFVDATDGATAEIALDITEQEVLLSKNGGAFTLKGDTTHGVHDAAHNGWYTIPLSTTDTNTLGALSIAINMAGALPVWKECMVVPANVWDSLFGADILDVSVTQWIGTACHAAGTAGVPEVAVHDQATVLVDAVWDEAVAGHTAATTFGLYLGGAPTIGATLSADVTNIHTDVGTAITDIAAVHTHINDIHDTDLPAVKVDTAAILVDTGTTLDGRIPATLVSGRIDASIGAVAANAITAASINDGAIDAATFAAGAINAAAIADAAIDAATFAAGAINAAAVADGAIDAATFAAGAIDAAAIAADAIGASELAADAVAEIADQVWDELASGHTTASTFGKYLGGAPAGATVAADVAAVKVDTAAILVDTGTTLETDIDAILADTNELQTDWHDGGRLDLLLDAAGGAGTPPTAAEVADAVWDETATGHVSAGKAGEQLWTDVDAILEDTGTTLDDLIDTEISTIAGYLDTEIAAILADTNELQTDWHNGGRLDLLLDAAVAGSGAGAVTWVYTLTSSVDATPIADAQVWATTDSAGANVIASGITTTLGKVTFYLDAGTYYYWRAKSGWNFTNPDIETVA